jgi:Mn2+/Fe2+ NRAMP family transporter
MSEEQRINYPPLAPELAGDWRCALRVFGPGAIIASVTVGTGETIFAPRAGAIFGYGLFWVVLLAVVCKGVLVYTGARHLVLAGEHPLESWARFPGPRRWVPILVGTIAVVSFPLWVAALTDAVSSLLVWITGAGAGNAWGRPLWGTLLILLAMAANLVQTYTIVERVSAVILALKILFVFVAVVIVSPDWLAALAGTFVPRLPAYEPWVASAYPDVAARAAWLEVAVLLGTVGGGVQDYIGYVGFMREKRWGASDEVRGGPHRLPTNAEQIARGRRWLRVPFLDILFSFASVFLITSCFMLLGAAVLHPLRQVPTNADLYSKQAQFLAIIHPALTAVYKAGILVAISGAVYATFEVYVRSAYETLRAVAPKVEWDVARVRRWVVLYAGVGGLLLLWSGLKTVTLASIVSPLAGVLGCGLWCLAMMWTDRTQMPPAYQMSARLLLLTLAAGMVMTVIGAHTTLQSWFG